MGNMSMKHIQKDEVIIKRVRDRSIREDYTVKENAHVVFVCIVRATRAISINVSVHLAGKDARADIIGVVFGADNARVDIQTVQHHRAPSTTSNLLVKTVMEGHSTCMYEGSIVVDTLAQKTDAYQRNENILLDEHAHAVSKPALEILANDVRCTHGAIIKTIDPTELWYMATRGIPDAIARAMITNGFFTSAFAGISDPAVRNELEQEMQTMYK